MKSAQPVGVLIVDDHQLVRAGIRACLEAVDGIEVLGEAADAEAALAQAEALEPQVVVLDISMPRATGLDLLPELRRRVPDAGVLVLSMHDERDYAVPAAEAGASGFLMKDCPPSELIEAVRAVAAGGRAFSEAAEERLVGAHVARSLGISAPSPLTGRQRDVLIGVAAGRTNRKIADELGIGVRTVETHRAELMRRLGIKSVAGLTRYAMERGYIERTDTP